MVGAWVLGRDEPVRGGGSRGFEGDAHGGAGVSVILVEARPGGGPRLHRHPYEEVFVVQEGRVTFRVEGEEIEGEGGTVVVVPAGAAHGFVNTGEGILRQVAIHTSERFVTEWLEG